MLNARSLATSVKIGCGLALLAEPWKDMVTGVDTGAGVVGSWLVVTAKLDDVPELWLSELVGWLPVIIDVGVRTTVPLLPEGPQPKR